MVRFFKSELMRGRKLVPKKSEALASQCPTTKVWPTRNGVIRPIVSERNKPNPFGVVYKFGKKKNKLRKVKCISEKDMEMYIAAMEGENA